MKRLSQNVINASYKKQCIAIRDRAAEVSAEKLSRQLLLVEELFDCLSIFKTFSIDLGLRTLFSSVTVDWSKRDCSRMGLGLSSPVSSPRQLCDSMMLFITSDTILLAVFLIYLELSLSWQREIVGNERLNKDEEVKYIIYIYIYIILYIDNCHTIYLVLYIVLNTNKM